MAEVKSIEAYNRFPQYVAPYDHQGPRDSGRRAGSAGRAGSNESTRPAPEVATPCCVLLRSPAGADSNRVGVALLSQLHEDVPRRYAFSALAVELPPPSSLGDFDQYEAVLFQPGLISFVAALTQTPHHAWAGTLGEISVAFSPKMRVIVRPANSQTGASGDPILTGNVAECATR